MSMRNLLWVGVVAAMAGGCGEGVDPTSGAAASGAGGTRATEGILRCPDPTTCTDSNGTGVYYAEGGDAYMDADMHLLITHFINNGSSVSFDGRYYSSSLGYYTTLSPLGTVVRADYGRASGLNVLSITETGTVPTITMQDPYWGTIYQATGGNLDYVTLYMNMFNPYYGKTLTYMLGFASYMGVGNEYVYQARWKLPGGTWQSYCWDASQNADGAVFQKSINVHPVKGTVVSNTSMVTFSCSLGAIAVAHRWGYDYLSTSTLFPSAIQMKRAAYCGDAHAYTVAGTQILIKDSSNIKYDPVTDGNIEAFWTPTGATCITNPRHPELVKLPLTCPSGTVLYACPSISTLSGTWLIDGESTY